MSVDFHALIRLAEQQVRDIVSPETPFGAPCRAENFLGGEQRLVRREALCFAEADIASVAAFMFMRIGRAKMLRQQTMTAYRGYRIMSDVAQLSFNGGFSLRRDIAVEHRQFPMKNKIRG